MDLFGRQPMAFGDSMAADSAALLFAGAGNNQWGQAGILTMQIQLSYSQPVMRIYDFGAPLLGVPASQYFIIGHPQGQGSMSRVIGPRTLSYCFYAAFGNGCGVQNNNFVVASFSGCNNRVDPSFIFLVNHCLLINYGFNVAAQDMMFNEALPFMFVSLEIPIDPSDCGLSNNAFSSRSLNAFQTDVSGNNRGDFVANNNTGDFVAGSFGRITDSGGRMVPAPNQTAQIIGLVGRNTSTFDNPEIT